jgi:hypothetical protein
MPFKVHVQHPEGHMRERLVTSDMAKAEAHYRRLCATRTPGPASAVFDPPVRELGPRRHRLDIDYPDDCR